MPLKRHFIERGIKQMQINEYLRKELNRSGFSGVDIQKTPLGVRITLKTSRPGLVIGKSGKRIRELTDELITQTANLNLQILEGSKVVEVKNSGINKGRAALRWIAKEEWGFILAIGDDRTDEDMFEVAPDIAYSLKVGLSSSLARFNLKSHGDVLSLLGEFISGGSR